MALPAISSDEYAVHIQLNTSIEDRGYHSRNKGREIQRPGIVDDICQGLLVQARIDRIVHGTETEDGIPSSLIVFGFRFHGINRKRRLQKATITILFQDEEKDENEDPIPICLWPNGDFTLGETTEIDIEGTKGAEVAANAGTTYVGANSKKTWERKTSYRKTDRASLTGSIFLDTRVRDYGPANCVRLTVTENETAQTGLVTDLRAAVLVRRTSESRCFTARVKVDAEAHFLYDLVKGFRDILGFSPANDPIIFKPGKAHHYIRPATLAGFLEDKLAEAVDENNLNAQRLDKMAAVLGATALTASVEDLSN
ncbi:hypothetical protein BU24DRAFT_454864 [Aaosphaeria arxii CBS 175.79]|uniref:Uncharacterized protein n=1 Tax=Aaosphaeria arxii CBS 175.79 TaxID=1450172 RepID=A0A6A5XCH2_9PLEO|nr:uncharacterized protein BU24DRAFT_454864 [Aaosphaeria arxii CBS 175.79]KAF2010507.1 hypothetical protein BU24DRAFT_454864 [Aaosphaeria arxii CBS 175.79]